MFRCWVALVLVAALWAGPAEAAELTGFGPIKFGMTKEQAEAALEASGIEANWQRGDKILRYEYPLHDQIRAWTALDESTLDVKQMFENGLAIDVFLDLAWRSIFSGYCFPQQVYLISSIIDEYDSENIMQEEIDNRYFILNKIHGNLRKYYLMPFENESFLHIAVSENFDDTEESGCSIWVWYHAPVPEPIPF